MLRLTMSTEEYLQIGEEVKIVFLGGSKNHLRIMVDAPKEYNVVRSKVIENNAKSEEERAQLPHYYAVPDLPEKYRRKRIMVNDSLKKGTIG
ncbi:carbon storage regulator [bacterium 0.1xD8-71]|nr:carbon storage regulator [bacterium 0.1xD8-71]